MVRADGYQGHTGEGRQDASNGKHGGPPKADGWKGHHFGAAGSSNFVGGSDYGGPLPF
jgi:hypothetical protein